MAVILALTASQTVTSVKLWKCGRQVARIENKLTEVTNEKVALENAVGRQNLSIQNWKAESDRDKAFAARMAALAKTEESKYATKIAKLKTEAVPNECVPAVNWMFEKFQEVTPNAN